ncbi:MAG: NAD(P)-dependent oxidoreductase, partial [Pseudomonadota bacterium]|nr:NAD(P)-dependent oxidoreductase [Pseudomonadota bacterium]
MTRILLLGSNGQVGYELARSLGPLAEIIAPARIEFDLSASEQLIADKIQQLKPDLVINAAAYTAVDKAETETELAWQINATAPAVMAAICELMNIPLIHFSTDYVFDGNSQYPWNEADQTAPLNVYGQSKLAGEEAIRDSQVKHAIFRTSWVYGLRGHNFLNTMR